MNGKTRTYHRKPMPKNSITRKEFRSRVMYVKWFYVKDNTQTVNVSLRKLYWVLECLGLII